MTGRNYDFTLAVNNATNFSASNLIIGATTKTVALVVNVDAQASTLKVKLSNSLQSFQVGEVIYSNVSTYIGVTNSNVTYTNTASQSVNGNSYIINGSTNTFSLPVTGIGNLFKENITVYQNGRFLPPQFWVYPAITAIGYTGITIKPLLFNPKTDNGVVEAGFFPGLGGLLGTNPEVIGTTEVVTQAVKSYEWFNIDTNSVQQWYYTVPEVAAQDTYAYVPPADIVNLYSPTGDSSVYTMLMPTANTPTLTVQVQLSSVNANVFTAAYKTGEATTASATISSVTSSPFIAEKNAFQQRPLVRLYTIYYPGEFYPPTVGGNPSTDNSDTAWSWPYGFPFRFAEIRGDYISDITYRVQYGGVEYLPYPINSSGIQIDSSGKVNDSSITISNFDGLVATIVEDAYLFGYNSSNNSSGIVRGETVFNIDPKTNPANVHYDAATAAARGINAAFDYATTRSRGETWTPLKQDTRDLLGGVIEIKTTFANFLDFWPEYSSVLSVESDRIQMRSTAPYRVGDVIHSNNNAMSSANTAITAIVPPYLVTNHAPTFITGDNIYIQNPDASADDYILDNFKINSLESMDEIAARFSLTSWLQYFKLALPKRKYFKNTCPWVYKGAECQYPTSGSGTIPGSDKVANGFFTINNVPTGSASTDVCAKNLVACALRNNEIHFGAFPSSGVTVPR